jgi:hypothetical protein
VTRSIQFDAPPATNSARPSVDSLNKNKIRIQQTQKV